MMPLQGVILQSAFFKFLRTLCTLGCEWYALVVGQKLTQAPVSGA